MTMMNQACNCMSHRSVFKKHVYRMNWMGISGWYGMRYTALSKNLLEIKNSQAFATGTALVVSVLFWHFFSIFWDFFEKFLGLVEIFVWLLVHQNLTLSGICHWHCPRRLCPWLNHVDCLLQSPGITYTYIIYILCYLSLSYLTYILCYLYLSYLTILPSYIILCYLILQSSGPDTYQKSHLWRWAYSDILILIASSFLRLRNDSSVGNHLGYLAWSIFMQNIIIMPVLPPGMTPELEIILAEGAGMEPGYSSDKVSISVSPSSLSSYSWSSSPLPSLSQLLDAKCSKLITVDKMIIFIQLDKVMEKCNRCRLGQISLQGPWHRNLCKFYFSSLNWMKRKDVDRLATGEAWWGDLWGGFCDGTQEPRHAFHWTLQVN